MFCTSVGSACAVSGGAFRVVQRTLVLLGLMGFDGSLRVGFMSSCSSVSSMSQKVLDFSRRFKLFKTVDHK